MAAYQDSRGIWTIGVGHAATGMPPTPCAGMTITEAQCDALLAADLAPVEAVITAAVKVPITQNEFDAMVSLGFNIGAGGLRKSSVIRKLNLGDVQGSADAFLLWDHPAELTGRRAAERRQFLEAGEPIAEARAASLNAKAAAAKDKAKATTTGGAAIAAAGVATTAAVASTHHHLAWFVGGFFAIGALVDGVMSILHDQRATALAANAAAQVAAAPSPASPTKF